VRHGQARLLRPAVRPLDPPGEGTATRERLLNTAIRLFSQSGFEHVAVRDICREAGANLAAVNYHFGDKLGLYMAVVDVAVGIALEINALTMLAGPASSADDRFRHYVRVYVGQLMNVDARTSWCHELIQHEQVDPTPAASVFFEKAIRPRIAYLGAVIADLIGCALDDPKVSRSVASVQAQCLFYRPDPFRVAVLGEWPVRGDSARAVADHIIAFSLAGIRAIR
jgi:TetR/AcrR family transcriptional regulator, regulator of cefoperazone and chloramphenicol sensitivity